MDKTHKRPPNWQHGESHKTPEHRTWKAIQERCFHPNHASYKNYGGRGIRVDLEWLGRGGYAAFLAEMGRRPSAAHSIDRIDSNANYGPRNCRWATRTEQNRNRRSNRVIPALGSVRTLAEWAERTGLSESLIRARIDRLGWPIERALTETATLGKNHLSTPPTVSHPTPAELASRRDP
jgi:hypothetical protein